ncbi:hypothetical protein GCM10010347_63640 [Streptomyces cirratus]|uniref:Uncharacterized protein n=1 Tax=Streptomyces cirratus TaxID=68187 RepID=A0ABQ3F569_9ACTN|nr:hypothetical protein GCM10010347_63640 [Streptomyces cirratus]
MPAPRPATKPRPEAKARPSARTPHRPVPPAPGTEAGTREMARPCRAARGVTSPAAAGLCRQTYGH